VPALARYLRLDAWTNTEPGRGGLVGRSRAFFVLCLAFALIGVGAALYRYLPPGYDYYYWYWPIPRAWLAGGTQLYDAASREFYSPPWALWLLIPYALLQLQWGMVALFMTTLVIVSGVSWWYA